MNALLGESQSLTGAALFGRAGIPDWRCTRQVPADCWFVSAAAALAHRRPGDIVRMITAQGDGTCTVRFPAPIRTGNWFSQRDADAVTIRVPVPAEGYSLAADGSMWLSILEKAYAEILQRHRRQRNGTPRDRIHGTRSLGEGIRVLTGHAVNSDWIWPAWLTRKSTTRARLQAAFAANRIVTASTRYFAGRRVKQRLAKAGLAQCHVYSVLDYCAASDRLQIRNPWGGGGTEEDGVSWISLDEFYACFVEIGYE